MSIATELTNLTNNITSAYNAINTKGGTMPANKNTANLANAIDSIPSGGGGSVVNAVIANYKATASTIDANTFVEFVCSVNAGTDTQLSTTNYTGEYVSAVALDSSRVFIAHRSGNYLYGMVCTISGTTITAGTDTQLSTGLNSYYYISSVLLDTDKVFIAHRNGSDLYGLVCTVSGITITAGTDTEISTSPNAYQYASAVVLDSSRIFIAHRNSSNTYGIVCTISGTAITHGTDTRIKSSYYNTISATLVETNKIFVTYGNQNGILYGVVCTINNTSLTVGTEATINSNYTSSSFCSSLTINSSGKVLTVYGKDETGGITKIYGTFCTISNNSISIETQECLHDNNIGSIARISAVKIDTDKVAISAIGGLGMIYLVCAINGNSCQTIVDEPISSGGSYTSIISTGTNVFSIIHAYNNSYRYLYAEVFNTSEITIQPTTSQFTNIGLTKTECTTSTSGEVWVLNT